MVPDEKISIGILRILDAEYELRLLRIEDPYDVLVFIPTLIYVRGDSNNTYRLIEEILDDEELLANNTVLSRQELCVALSALDDIGFIKDNIDNVRDILSHYSGYRVIDYTYAMPGIRILYHMRAIE